MLNFAFIVFCVLGGLLIRQMGKLPPGAFKSINTWILNIALPACFLRYIPYIERDKHILLPVIAPLIVWTGCWIAMSLYASKAKISNASRGALKLTGGLSNTAFLGFIIVYYSEKEISIAILYDQSSFILLSTAGIITAISERGQQKITSQTIMKSLVKFPPFVACMIALMLPPSIDISVINPFLDKMIGTIGPMALFSIGLQLDFSALKTEYKNLTAGIFYKLLIAPMLVLLFALAFGQRGIIAQISVFQAAMPVLATAGVLADEYELNPPLSSLMVGISILLSFFTMGIWWFVLQFLE